MFGSPVVKDRVVGDGQKRDLCFKMLYQEEPKKQRGGGDSKTLSVNRFNEVTPYIIVFRWRCSHFYSAECTGEK